MIPRVVFDEYRLLIDVQWIKMKTKKKREEHLGESKVRNAKDRSSMAGKTCDDSKWMFSLILVF